ncbi:MAG: multidrug effflux MFS transporter [Rhizobiaceae bacterium]
MSKQPSTQKNWRGATTPPRITTLVLIAGMSVMAMSIFLPVLPEIGADMNVPQSVVQYVLTIFLASMAIVQLIIGPLSDRYGRRPILLISYIVFLAATLICIFSPSIEVLLIGRVLQSASAASLVLSRAIIRDLYERKKSASMIGYVTMAMAVIPMLSPAIGGYIGDQFGWRATFVVLFLVALPLLLLVYFDLGETHPPRRISISIQFSDYLALLKEPVLWGYILCATLCSGAFFAFLGGAPFVGTEILDMNPSSLGLSIGSVAFGYMFGNYISGRFSEKLGIEPMMLYGGLVSSVGVALTLLLMGGFTPIAAYLFGPMILVGLGNGMTLPNANAGAVSVRPELSGSASGLAGAISMAGGAALAGLSSSLISAENQAMPLYIIMFLSTLAGSLIAALMFWKTSKQQL